MNTKQAPFNKFLRILFVPLCIALVALLLTYGIVKTPAIVKAQADNKLLPIYCVDRSADKGAPKVSLSFDAAWGNEDTAKILEILAKHNVKVTFFMTGGWIEKYPEDVKSIAAAGHDLANHSENHKQMSKLSAKDCADELLKPHEKVKALTGIDMTLFRPPYGDYNNTLIKTANEQCNYHVIQWDVDSLDWKDYTAQQITDRILNHKHLGNGSIILMHNGAKHTAEALESIILDLQEKGYELVPISQLILPGEYTIDHEGRQHAK